MQANNSLDKIVSAYRDGDKEKAVKLCLKALKFQPDSYNHLHFLGVIYLDDKKLDKALGLFKKALTISDRDSNLFNNIGLSYYHKGQYAKAIDFITQAIAKEQNPIFFKHLALAHHGNEDVSGAGVAFNEYCRRANSGEAYAAYAKYLKSTGRYAEAEAQYLRALTFNDRSVPINRDLLQLYVDWQRREPMHAQFQKYIALEDRSESYGWYLFHLNNSSLEPEQLFAYYKEFNARYCISADAVCVHEKRDDISRRKLRLAYISGDMHSNSSANRFLLPLIENHDKSNVEITLYHVSTLIVEELIKREKGAALASELQNRKKLADTDPGIKRYKKLADRWVDVTKLSDLQLVERIKRDKIDVLVDLSGHTKGQRLIALSHKPAPVQLTWLGYGYTTGLTAMDYFLGDDNYTPPGCEPYFSEQIYRIKRPIFTYKPYESMPEVVSSPALENGYITFGCFSRVVRLNDEVIKVWSEILRRVPKSKLVLNTEHFAIEQNRLEFHEKFASGGVDPSRIILMNTWRPETWNVYNQIDISLDPFPHNAGATIMDSLWMGVPVVSLVGKISINCFGAMMLRPLKLDDWLATSVEDYIEISVNKATDINALNQLRKSLRERIQQSPFMREREFSAAMEAAYRDMVERFNRSKS